MAESFKIINKQKRLKRSKLFIDKEVYTNICASYGLTLEQHLDNLKRNNITMESFKILGVVGLHINTIIR